MENEEDLWVLEECFWTDGAESVRSMTAKNAVFVFPYPVGILQGADLWRDGIIAQRWRSVILSERYCKQQKDLVVLVYHVSAERADEPIYKALCTSTFINDDGKWQRITHQQTPVS